MTELRNNIPSSTFLMEVGKGNIAKHSNVRWVSWSNDVGETFQSININGQVIYTFPTSAATRSVVSTSANDTNGGTGLNVVLIQGLDVNYDPIQEFITLNGLTPVITASSFLRIEKIIGISAGATGNNEGTIDVYTGTDIYVRIRIGDNIGVSGALTVPNGKTYYPIAIVFNNGKDSDIEFVSRTRLLGGVFFNANPTFTYQETIVTIGLTVNPLPAKTDITPIVRKVGGAGIAKCSFLLDIVSVDD